MTFNRKTAIAATLLAATIATPTYAQDAGQTFTGPYISVFGGATMTGDSADDGLVFDTDRDGDFDDTVFTSTGGNAFSPGFCNDRANGPTPPCTNDGRDVEYGVRVGLDGRPGGGAFLAGVMVEAGRTELSDATTGFSTTPASYTVTKEMDYAISARGRLGIVAGDSALFYGTGGISYAKIDQTFTTTNTANSFTQVNDGEMAWGYQAGGGVEVALSRGLSLGMEYLYSQYKDDDYYVEVGPGTAGPTNPFLLDDPTGTDLTTSSDKLRTHSLRVTGTLRF